MTFFNLTILMLSVFTSFSLMKLLSLPLQSINASALQLLFSITLGITLKGDAADADAANGKSYLLSTCVAVVVLLLHSFLKCPMFWHL